MGLIKRFERRGSGAIAPPPSGSSAELPRILSYDPGTWGIQMVEFQSMAHWISWDGGQHKTGSIEFGPITLRNRLYLCISGHATNEMRYDVVVDGDPVITRYGDDYLQGGFRPSPFPTITDTSAHFGEVGIIRLTDNHSGSNGWVGVNWDSLILGDQ